MSKRGKYTRKPKREYSKSLLIQESALLWVLSLLYIALAFYCIYSGYTGSLPWITAGASLPWGAYGVSQVFYYKKSMLENSKGGIKYETVMKELDAIQDKYTSILTNNSDFNDIIKDLIKNSNISTSTTTTETVYTDTQDTTEAGLDVDYGI